MARIATDPNYSSPTFPRATAGTDLFLKEDVQALAAAVSTHDHSTGKGVALTAGAIPNGTITSAMIADGTIVAGDIADGTITSAKIADGTLVAADHADASLTNAKLGPDVARANLLTNGGFEIWQRGNGPFTANGAYTADRWVIGLGGSDTLSVSRDTTNIDTAGGSQVAAACTFVLSGGAGLSNLVNYPKVADGYNIANRTLSASVRVRTSTANAVRVGLHNGSAFTYSSYHTGGGGWETLTVTATMAASGVSLGQLSVLFAASCTAYVDNAMLVVGSQPADYAPLHPADDLARCLRYYEVLGGVAGAILKNWQSYAAGTDSWWIVYGVKKAVTPTVTKTGTWTVSNSNQPGVGGATVGGNYLTATAAAAGNTYYQCADATCLLTIEGNP